MHRKSAIQNSNCIAVSWVWVADFSPPDFQYITYWCVASGPEKCDQNLWLRIKSLTMLPFHTFLPQNNCPDCCESSWIISWSKYMLCSGKFYVLNAIFSPWSLHIFAIPARCRHLPVTNFWAIMLILTRNSCRKIGGAKVNDAQIWSIYYICI